MPRFIWFSLIFLLAPLVAQDDLQPPAETAWVNLIDGEVQVYLPDMAEPVVALRGMACPQGSAIEVAEGAFVQLVAARARIVLALSGGQSWRVGEPVAALAPQPERTIASVIDALRGLAAPPLEHWDGRGLEGGLRSGPDGRDPFLIAPQYVSELDPVVFLWFASEPAAAWQLSVWEEETEQLVWSSPRLAAEVSAFHGGLDVHELEMAVSYIVRLEGLDASGQVSCDDRVYLERLDPDFRRTRGLVAELAAVDAVFAGVDQTHAAGQASRSFARGELYARWGLYGEAAVRFIEAARTDPSSAAGSLWRLAGMLVALGVDAQQALPLADALLARAQ